MTFPIPEHCRDYRYSQDMTEAEVLAALARIGAYELVSHHTLSNEPLGWADDVDYEVILCNLSDPEPARHTLQVLLAYLTELLDDNDPDAIPAADLATMTAEVVPPGWYTQEHIADMVAFGYRPSAEDANRFAADPSFWAVVASAAVASVISCDPEPLELIEHIDTVMYPRLATELHRG